MSQPVAPTQSRSSQRLRSAAPLRTGWLGASPDERAAWRDDFTSALEPGGGLWDERRGRANLAGLCLAHYDLSGLSLAGADLSRADLRGADLSGADLTGCDLFAASLEGASLNRARLSRANLHSTKLAEADLSGADLSDATLHQCDLTRVDFRTARLFGTRITEPTWWVNLPTATLRGEVLFQSAIPEHPIQGVLGLPPLLRRQIADVQHLRDMHRRSHGAARRLVWLWGVCCGFGQSLGRLGLTAVAILLLFVGAYMLSDFSLARPGAAGGDVVRYVARPDFGQALFFAITTFTAPGTSGQFPVGALGKVLLSAQGLVSFLLLGGLLSIFANKVSRLS
ncbi:MAG: pentapeptide repeat-containing protein [Leptolyngbya sp. PLA1]|nr:pentapeptide repeat-containing protein [Leptolyngbya sp. PLA1]